MSGNRTIGWWRWVLAVPLVLVVSGCGSSGGITAPPLAASIGQSFANLYVLQQVEQGHPKPSVSGLRARASCQKGTAQTVQRGAGDDWVCQITFLIAGPATPVTALYTVNVQTNGCYAADADGPAAVNGARSIGDPPSGQRNNPLWLIDGCFELG